MKTKNKAKTTSVSSAKTSPISGQLSHANDALLIDVDNLSVVWGGNTIIDRVSFCIHKGEFIGLIGPNGAGKTTLLKVLLGLVPATSGQIMNKKRVVGYVPQRGFMREHQIPISVIEIVKLGAKGDETRALAALEEVEMLAFARRRFNELSGGQQQRVLIAKAMASMPDILILDEPTTGIDEQSQAAFYRILSHLQAKGVTVLMVSHDVDMVLNQVTRVICLNQSILYDGRPEHFETDRYLPSALGRQHRLLHHQHGGEHV
jgi:zinc transport system ATP-binding protein